jgi:opacity protein-like surface antigen
MDRSFLFGTRLLGAAILILLATSAQAADFSEDNSISEPGTMGYDSIVNELNSENQKSVGEAKLKARNAVVPDTSEDAFARVWMHGGIGYISTMQNVNLPGKQGVQLNQSGFQAALGIDLFSKTWMAEGTARNYGDVESHGSQVSLKEFELKLYYRNQFAAPLGLRLGGGLGARYMHIQNAGVPDTDYTTPAAVLTAGLDLFVSKKLSLGADLSSRNSLISDTIDKNSLDLTLRMDTHF